LEGLLILDYYRARSAAEESYRRAVELDPEHDGARWGLAIILLDKNSFSEAAEHFEYLRQRQPDNLGVQARLADCQAGLGGRAEAERLLDGVLAQEPRVEPALALLGRLALEDGEYAKAEAYLRHAIALNPKDRRARTNLVLCLRRDGKAEEAQQQQEEIEQQDKSLERIIEIINKELPKRPRDPALHCTLGHLLLRDGYTEAGVRLLRSALRLDPNYAPAQEALAAHAQQGSVKDPRPD